MRNCFEGVRASCTIVVVWKIVFVVWIIVLSSTSTQQGKGGDKQSVYDINLKDKTADQVSARARNPL